MNSKKMLGLVLGLICFSLIGFDSTCAETLTIPGTGDGLILLRQVADAFNTANPSHKVIMPDSIGSSGGVKMVGIDQAVLGRVARKIKNQEQSYGLVYLPIAKMPAVFFVNRDVTVLDLTAKQVNEIYSGNIRNWQQVGGDSGRIRVIRREEGDSTLAVLKRTFPGFSDIKITGFSKTTVTTQETLNAVAEISGSIGFGPYIDAVNTDVTILSINGVTPLESDYPSFTELGLVYKEKNRKGLVAAFIDFVLSPKGNAIFRQGDAIPAQ